MQYLEFFFDNTLHFLQVLLLIFIFRGGFAKLKTRSERYLKIVQEKYRAKIELSNSRKIKKEHIPKFLQKQEQEP